MNEWTQIKKWSEQDPPWNKEVLVYLKEDEVSALAHLFDTEGSLRWWKTGLGHSLPYDAVSHWMRKPDAPGNDEVPNWLVEP